MSCPRGHEHRIAGYASYWLYGSMDTDLWRVGKLAPFLATALSRTHMLLGQCSRVGLSWGAGLSEPALKSRSVYRRAIHASQIEQGGRAGPPLTGYCIRVR